MVAARRRRAAATAPAVLPDLVGRGRRRRGAGFAVRRGLWRWALAVACEPAAKPGGIALRGGAALTSRWFEVPSGRLHARVADGPARDATAVVLVHGVIVSSRYLLPAAVELAADRPVVVPDLPGYGLSGPPHGAPTVGLLADAALECATAVGHERVALVGNSFGAQVAVEAALRHPERVDRLALLGPTVDPAARSLVRQYVRWQRNAPDEHLSVVPVMARDLADVGPRRAARLLRTMLDDPIEGKLPAVRCPALVVRGGRDRVVPDRWARRVSDLLPRGRLAVVPGYAHMAHYSGALAVSELLREFLADSGNTAIMSVPDTAPGDEAPPDRQETGPNVCPDCGGSGRRDDDTCPTCAGTGVVEEAVGGG